MRVPKSDWDLEIYWSKPSYLVMTLHTPMHINDGENSSSLFKRRHASK